MEAWKSPYAVEVLGYIGYHSPEEASYRLEDPCEAHCFKRMHLFKSNAISKILSQIRMHIC